MRIVCVSGGESTKAYSVLFDRFWRRDPIFSSSLASKRTLRRVPALVLSLAMHCGCRNLHTPGLATVRHYSKTVSISTGHNRDLEGKEKERVYMKPSAARMFGR